MSTFQDWEEVRWVKKTQPQKTNNSKKDLDEIPSLPKLSLDSRQTIIKARNSKKLTQKQLANLLNITQNKLNNFENGKEIPNKQEKQKLRNALGIKFK
jgi:ribosome-binding protein aMBF1 (putative translation factor)|uniref:HTH cro/C1-type domain-containing protein n=1 Tax=viral metagenome TaxID=1070528 RepID=A0A6C0IZ46_9ZZZZ